ncbi:MAG TPA: antitoxin [Candidatus Dormibacteraeota bacterium]|nr:antitoxin [Candidatus Dormibacteraeota bacterium]
MRTTIAIDDQLLTTAKVAARQRGYTLGRLIEEALRRELVQHSAVLPPEVPVFRGGTGPRPGVDLRSNRALIDLIEPANPVDQR